MSGKIPFECLFRITKFSQLNSLKRKTHSLASLSSQNGLFEYSSKRAQNFAKDDFHVVPDFITVEEESRFLSEIEPKWGKLNYQPGHWDNAIQLYRELEVSSWSDKISEIVTKVHSYAFCTEDTVRKLTHILDLSPNGFIKPHVDSKKFCGYCIAGLSLMSPSVMKFCDEQKGDVWFKALLPQRSLYIMKDKIRYNFTHEILKTEESYINGAFIQKERRISVIFRTEPTREAQSESDIFKVIPIPLDET